MSTLQRLNEIEKDVTKKHQPVRENEVVLGHADFKDGKLSVSGYNRLKQECEYIEYGFDIEITIPKQYNEKFKDTLESMAAVELTRIKKDRRLAKIKSLTFFIIGILWLVLNRITLDIGFLYELTLIATWVFVWTAVETFFFDRGKLQDRRYSLLQILAAKVIAKETEIEQKS